MPQVENWRHLRSRGGASFRCDDLDPRVSDPTARGSTCTDRRVIVEIGLRAIILPCVKHDHVCELAELEVPPDPGVEQSQPHE